MLKTKLFLATVVALHFATNAHATGGVICQSEDGQAEISIGLHRVIIYSPMNAYARLGKKEWKGVPVDNETPLGSSQGRITDTNLNVDFADIDMLKIIIRLTVDLTAEETEKGFPGNLSFENGIKRPVSCAFE